MVCGVYKITNPIGKSYVGSSTNIQKRFYLYKRMLEKSQRKLFASFEKYGVDAHVFEIVEECKKSVLLDRERVIGVHFNVLNDGLNCILPGLMCDETKRKIGDRHKGKTISAEHIEKMISAVRGKRQTAEHINKRKVFGSQNPMFGRRGRLAPMFGKKHSLLARKKMSISRKGRNLLGSNTNAKKVINVFSGETWSSAKEAAVYSGINYSTFKSILQGRLKNTRGYQYV